MREVFLKKLISAFLLVIFCFLAENSIFTYVSLSSQVPNMLLIATCSLGVLRGQYTGMFTGFFCGLLTDIFYMDFLGIYALLFLYIGFLAGSTHPYYEEQDVKLPLIVIMGCDILLLLVEFVLFYVMQGKSPVSYYLIRVAFPEFFYTLAAAIFFFPLVAFLEYAVVQVEFFKKVRDIRKKTSIPFPAPPHDVEGKIYTQKKEEVKADIPANTDKKVKG